MGPRASLYVLQKGKILLQLGLEPYTDWTVNNTKNRVRWQFFSVLNSGDICFCIPGCNKVVYCRIQPAGVSPCVDANEKIHPETKSVSKATNTQESFSTWSFPWRILWNL